MAFVLFLKKIPHGVKDSINGCCLTERILCTQCVHKGIWWCKCRGPCCVFLPLESGLSILVWDRTRPWWLPVYFILCGPRRNFIHPEKLSNTMLSDSPMLVCLLRSTLRDFQNSSQTRKTSLIWKSISLIWCFSGFYYKAFVLSLKSKQTQALIFRELSNFPIKHIIAPIIFFSSLIKLFHIIQFVTCLVQWNVMTLLRESWVP